MKKLINLLFLSILTTTLLVLQPINNFATLNNYDRSQLNSLLNKSNENYDPRLLDIKVDIYQEAYIGWQTQWWWSTLIKEDVRIFDINVSNYGFNNVGSFREYFDQVNVNFDFKYKTSFPDDSGQELNIFTTKNFEYPTTWNIANHYISGVQNEAKASGDIKLEFSDYTSTIKVSTIAKIWLYHGGNAYWVGASSNLLLRSITFTSSKYKWYNTSQKLKNAFSFDKKFKLLSQTSNFLNSDNNISLNSLTIVDSNKRRIINEVKSRIKVALGDFYDLWKKYINFDDLILTFDETKKEVKIAFQDITNNYFQRGLFPQLTLKVDLRFDLQIDSFSKNWAKISNKPINITSSNSINAFDDNNFGNNPANLSNKQKVINQINARIENVFMLYRPEIKPLFDSMFSISYSDEGQNNIKIYCKTSENKIFETVVAVNVKPTNEYYNKGIRERLEINVGKILDINKNDGSLIDDKPSYNKKNNVFTYHAPIKLSLALQDHDKSTIMKVNGIEVPIYNQKMEIELKDRRKDKFTDKTNYKIEITSLENNQNTNFSFNIEIVSTSSSINFKWLGWNPTNDPNADEQYYQQWLMTQKTIMDEQGNQINNALYRPDLNASNGTISNLIYVENKNDANQTFKHDNLFLQDNYDENWNKIDLITTTKSGYIAQAIVVNSGFKNILINPSDNVYRQKLNKTTFEPETSWEKVDLKTEKQFSIPGLYHYKIQQLNFVDQVVLPIADEPEAVPAKAGTFIHKLIYIDNNVDALKNNFLNLDFIKDQNINNNITIKNMWDTYQAKHLKQFLAINNFNIKNIHTLTYEKIISLWEEYVSTTAKAQKLPKPDIFIDLKKYNFNHFMLYCEYDFEFKNLVRQQVINNLRTINNLHFEEHNDYQIMISNDNINFKALDAVNLKDLGDIKVNNFDFYIKIKALNSSIYLGGQTVFKATNTKNVNNDFFDFAQLSIYNLNNNFSKFTTEKLKAYINNFIHNRMVETNKKWNYKLPILNKDYQIIYDDNLENFINNNGSTLNVTIKALNNSVRAIGTINFNLINDFNAPEPEPIPEQDPIVDQDGKIDIAHIFKILDLGKIITNNDFLVKYETLLTKLLALNVAYLNNYQFKTTDFEFEVISKMSEMVEVKLTTNDNDQFTGTIITNYRPQTFNSKSNLTLILIIAAIIFIIPILIIVSINKLQLFSKFKKRNKRAKKQLN